MTTQNDSYEGISKLAIRARVAGCTGRNQQCGPEPIDVVGCADCHCGERVIFGYRAADGRLWKAKELVELVAAGKKK